MVVIVVGPGGIDRGVGDDGDADDYNERDGFH